MSWEPRANYLEEMFICLFFIILYTIRGSLNVVLDYFGLKLVKNDLTMNYCIFPDFWMN